MDSSKYIIRGGAVAIVSHYSIVLDCFENRQNVPFIFRVSFQAFFRDIFNLHLKIA